MEDPFKVAPEELLPVLSVYQVVFPVPGPRELLVCPVGSPVPLCRCLVQLGVSVFAVLPESNLDLFPCCTSHHVPGRGMLRNTTEVLQLLGLDELVHVLKSSRKVRGPQVLGVFLCSTVSTNSPITGSWSESALSRWSPTCPFVSLAPFTMR